MTFKHTKFDESAIMRSFEKTARNKGLITDEPAVYGLVKQAASKIDLKPTENLTLNIVKLCEGLRSKGFSKYANEIENKFMTYKRAETLYDVHNETGDDVVDQAHPDGSHKLEGVDGDSTFETILDQHEMIKKIVDKNPTGKLSNNKDILRAVKVALGQSGAGGASPVEQTELDKKEEVSSEQDETSLQKAALIKLNNAVFTVNKAAKFFATRGDMASYNPNTLAFDRSVQVINNVQQEVNSANIVKVNDFKTILTQIGWMQSSIGGFLFGNSNSLVTNDINRQLSLASGFINSGLDILSGKVNIMPNKNLSTNSTDPSWAGINIDSDFDWAQKIAFKESSDLETYRDTISQNQAKLKYAEGFIATFKALIADLKILKDNKNKPLIEAGASTRWFKSVANSDNYAVVLNRFKSSNDKYQKFDWRS